MDAPKPNRKSILIPLLAFAALAIGGASGFFAFGFQKSTSEHDLKTETGPREDEEKTEFVQLPPMVVTLPEGAQTRHLRIAAHLEGESGAKHNVEAQVPRVVDALNTYLHALELADLADPAAMIRLRAQMMKRVELALDVQGVKDLLIMEFIVN